MNNSKLRVTIIGLNYSPEPTGNAPYTTSLAEGLSESGHEVTVLTGFPHYPSWRRNPEYRGWIHTEVLNGVRVKRLRHYVPRKPTLASRMHMELSFGLRVMFARWENPDAVLVVSPALFSSGMAIARARLKPNRPAVGLWVQDIYSRGIVETRSGGGLLAKVMGKFESTILQAADGVAAIHERFRTFIIDSLSVSPEQVQVIRNWTHLPARPVAGQQEMRARLNWAADDVVVLHAGNMGMKQGPGERGGRCSNRRREEQPLTLCPDGRWKPAEEAGSDGHRIATNRLR
ncbi:glycosyltransferase family 4 protein [Arthrobacter sp. StoSoilB13]|uniref:glycosyltransferase family 4 protein n=1 Tax=Arthrobacter sp. StoSoilB13 TaxID=2830993 RepID=UPI001CC7CB62|nr:glycosyltransferase family 4 protein [Arthrobacter sp. StoSoilB13]